MKKNQQEQKTEKISKVDWILQKNLLANYINYTLRGLIMFGVAILFGFAIRYFITDKVSIILPATFLVMILLSMILNKPLSKITIGFKIQEWYIGILNKLI